jgi:uncharacterized membrane protein YbhN (UPF0104 family)
MAGETDRRADAFASVVVERLLGFFVLLPMGLLALPFAGEGITEWKLVGTVWIFAGLIFVGAYVVLLRPVARGLSRLLGPLLDLLARFKARERLESAYEAVVSYNCCCGAVFKGLGLSVLSKLCWVLGCFLIAKAFSLDVGFFALLLIVPIVELARLIPISVSGLGVREATFVALLGQFGVENSLAFAYSVAVYVVFTLFALIGGLLYGTRQFAKRT